MRVLIDVANGRVDNELIEVLVRAGHVVERGTATVSAARFDPIRSTPQWPTRRFGK